MKPALAISGLRFAYPQQSVLLENLHLTVLPGERVGMIGGNGAGKTTLFLIIAGLLKPLGGQLELFDRSIKVGEFRPEIGLVFQNPEDQLFCPSVRDDIAFGPENMGFPSLEVERRVENALKITGIGALIDRVPHHLSGGEKCMTAIAAVLAMQPQLMLYDEPSANLDLAARRRLIHFLEASTTTRIISSHDLELILEVCDRVILLNHGTIIADGSPMAILSDRVLMSSCFLEVPASLKIN